MKNKITLFIALTISLVTFNSCDVEFDPNGDWEETTIVYGVLDQDADTNFIRVQRCFLGEGNYIEFARQKDSIYYHQDELEVSLYAFYEWESNGWDTINNARQKIYLNYTESYTKPEGGFYSEVAPIYYTTEKLNSDFIYYLVIKNTKTGNVVTSNTKLVANYVVNEPSNSRFEFRYNPTLKQNQIVCKWINQSINAKGEMGRLYQPAIKFNFIENGQLTHIFIDYSTVSNPFFDEDRTISYIATEREFLSQIKEKIGKRAMAERKFLLDEPTFELYVYACNEKLKNFMENNTPELSLSEKPIYTNIDNGVGIFASRRLHVKRSYTTWKESVEFSIQDLDLGFVNVVQP
ncbi:MAG: hypothetical protein PHN41_00910 [Bacteroidales bacterium]|jgi:hypothetical protein|nr:hypothetical protein [Bacteroidales bacterium]MDD4703314.1 hypothetical protein [Bacteroidales bacterium]MDX9798341.1 hypothetical protein [Bacteroidales bacterium]